MMNDKNHLILSAIGPDQVGLVAKISQFISRHGCNIEDSTMAVFCGEFAIIILITGEPGRIAELSRSSAEIEKETGLAVTVKTPAQRKFSEPFVPYKLVASCMDHPGVVYQISGILSSLGVNIHSMETKTYSAPESGTPLFQLEAKLSVPARLNVNVLRDRFAQIQAEENIDIEISALKNS